MSDLGRKAGKSIIDKIVNDAMTSIFSGGVDHNTSSAHDGSTITMDTIKDSIQIMKEFGGGSCEIQRVKHANQLGSTHESLGLVLAQNNFIFVDDLREQFRFPRSKKKRIRKKFSKNQGNFKASNTVYLYDGMLIGNRQIFFCMGRE